MGACNAPMRIRLKIDEQRFAAVGHPDKLFLYMPACYIRSPSRQIVKERDFMFDGTFYFGTGQHADSCQFEKKYYENSIVGTSW